jgi:hypothetical protein
VITKGVRGVVLKSVLFGVASLVLKTGLRAAQGKRKTGYGKTIRRDRADDEIIRKRILPEERFRSLISGAYLVDELRAERYTI